MHRRSYLTLILLLAPSLFGPGRPIDPSPLQTEALGLPMIAGLSRRKFSKLVLVGLIPMPGQGPETRNVPWMGDYSYYNGRQFLTTRNPRALTDSERAAVHSLGWMSAHQKIPTTSPV